VEGPVKRGHQTHPMTQTKLQRIMQTILTGVERQQETTAATLIRRGQKESGAIRRIQTRDGRRATFHSAVLPMVGLSISASNVCFFLEKQLEND